MRSGSKWPVIGPWPCAYASAYVDHVFISQNYDISISISTRRTNFFLCLCLCLCFSGFRYIKGYGLSRVKVYEKVKKICHRPTLYVIPNYSSFISFQRFGKGTQSVRDKSNLNIGYENYPKSVTFFSFFFYRDLSAGHVTSFSV